MERLKREVFCKDLKISLFLLFDKGLVIKHFDFYGFILDPMSARKQDPFILGTSNSALNSDLMATSKH